MSKSLKVEIPYRIVGADYSAQEPRVTAFFSQDEAMINAYKEKKDLYSVIASMSFGRSYEDCLEFYPEGTEIEYEGKKVICGYKTHQNKEGKTYRTMAKSILLGVLYGRGAASVGEQIDKSREEAQEIIDKFFKAFPKVKQWINDSMQSAHEKGYVEDVAGRRRRLPDAQLPKYKITFIDSNKVDGDFNPFIGCADRINTSNNLLLKKYNDKCEKIRSAKEYENLKQEALKEGIEIHSNTGFIAQAERQSVNARVQGSAATLTKCALIEIANDQRLKDIGAYLINTVHDEILLEAPLEYSKKAEEYLADDMIKSAKRFVTNVPMACDTYNVNAWYVDEIFVEIENDFKKIIEKESDVKVAFEKLCNIRAESTRSELYEIVKGYLGDYIPQDVNTEFRSLTAIN